MIRNNNTHCQIHENAFSISLDVTWRRRDRKKWRNQNTVFCIYLSLLPRTLTQWMYIAADCCLQTDTQCLSCSASYCTAHLLYKYCTNSTVCNWTVLTVITQKLLRRVQRLTAQHIYCAITVQTVQCATELYLQ